MQNKKQNAGSFFRMQNAGSFFRAVIIILCVFLIPHPAPRIRERVLNGRSAWIQVQGLGFFLKSARKIRCFKAVILLTFICIFVYFYTDVLAKMFLPAS